MDIMRIVLFVKQIVSIIFGNKPMLTTYIFQLVEGGKTEVRF